MNSGRARATAPPRRAADEATHKDVTGCHLFESPGNAGLPLRITVVAIGKWKAGPERDLFEKYAGRLRWPMTLKEVEEHRSVPPAQLTAREGELLLAARPKVGPGLFRVALDQRGKAPVEGKRIVGIDFRDGILFVPEVLLAANAMKAGMAILRPLLAETGAPKIGKMIIGTVKGDIHDIGKNLVAMMMEGAGFEVVILGINNPVENYLKAIDEHAPDILGMSALLTTTMPYMKVVIDALIEKGIRNDYIVLVGGAPLNEQFANAIGADAYCRDAAVAVETAKSFMAKRQGSAFAKKAG